MPKDHCPRSHPEPVTRNKNGQCIKCLREQGAEWEARNPERSAQQQREYYLRKHYGLTTQDFDSLLESQGGVCAICGRVSTDSRSLAVDHDHDCCPGKTSCGKCVRGLLCVSCNFRLLGATSDPDLLRRAADYLDRALV